MEYLKLAIVDSENYSDFDKIAEENFTRVIIFSNHQQLEANYLKTRKYKNFEVIAIIYGDKNKDNMDGYICAKVGEYIARYHDFRTYLSITIYSNDKIYKGISSYYTRKGYNISTSAPHDCVTGNSNTNPNIRIRDFLNFSDLVQKHEFKKKFKESSKDAFYRLISRNIDKDIDRSITDKFIENKAIYFSTKSRKIFFDKTKY